MANSATCHPIPEPPAPSAPANDAASRDLGRGLWLAHSNALELALIQAARNERPSKQLRERVLRACGIR